MLKWLPFCLLIFYLVPLESMFLPFSDKCCPCLRAAVYYFQEKHFLSFCHMSCGQFCTLCWDTRLAILLCSIRMAQDEHDKETPGVCLSEQDTFDRESRTFSNIFVAFSAIYK